MRQSLAYRQAQAHAVHVERVMILAHIFGEGTEKAIRFRLAQPNACVLHAHTEQGSGAFPCGIIGINVIFQHLLFLQVWLARTGVVRATVTLCATALALGLLRKAALAAAQRWACGVMMSLYVIGCCSRTSSQRRSSGQ